MELRHRVRHAVDRDGAGSEADSRRLVQRADESSSLALAFETVAEVMLEGVLRLVASSDIFEVELILGTATGAPAFGAGLELTLSTRSHMLAIEVAFEAV